MNLFDEEFADDTPVQIMEAPKNLYAEYTDDDGSKFYAAIVCMALTKVGDIVFCDTDEFGIITEIDSKASVKKYNEVTKEMQSLGK